MATCRSVNVQPHAKTVKTISPIYLLQQTPLHCKCKVKPHWNPPCSPEYNSQYFVDSAAPASCNQNIRGSPQWIKCACLVFLQLGWSEATEIHATARVSLRRQEASDVGSATIPAAVRIMWMKMALIYYSSWGLHTDFGDIKRK